MNGGVGHFAVVLLQLVGILLNPAWLLPSALFLDGPLDDQSKYLVRAHSQEHIELLYTHFLNVQLTMTYSAQST